VRCWGSRARAALEAGAERAITGSTRPRARTADPLQVRGVPPPTERERRTLLLSVGVAYRSARTCAGRSPAREGVRVAGGGHAESAPEVSMQVALVDEPGAGGDRRGRAACFEEAPGEHDALADLEGRVRR
jgi:hypothetical protein